MRRATTLPWYGANTADGMMIHPYTLPGELYLRCICRTCRPTKLFVERPLSTHRGTCRRSFHGVQPRRNLCPRSRSVYSGGINDLYTCPGVAITITDGRHLPECLSGPAGHWFGLLHTFQNGCAEPNDGCSDTAEEANPQFGCPTPIPNTCPGKPANQPLQDPIHNFMVRRGSHPLHQMGFP